MASNFLDDLTMDYRVSRCVYNLTDVEEMLMEQRGNREAPFSGMDKSGKSVCDRYAKGQCLLGDLCPLRHMAGDKQVVCKHWLRGLCKKGDGCEFLHEYDLSKMPECFFFSKYKACSNKECTFRHIDPDSKLKDCPWYDRGFCRHGNYCKHRHRRRVLCPNYLCGFCPDGKECKFTHPSFAIPTFDPKLASSAPRVNSSIICHNCHERGHKASQCPTLPAGGLPPQHHHYESTNRARNFVSNTGDFERRNVADVTCYKLKTWDGLISLALIIPFDEKPDQKEDHKFAIQHIMETLERLKAIKQMNKRVWLQVLFYSPLNECPKLEYSKPITGFADDLEYADWMLNDMKRLCASQKIYPINVVRNVARLGLQTPLFVSTDIENLFSEGYAHRAQKLANQLLLKENKNTVLVHRRFESDWSEPTPRLVKNLKALIERKKAFVFHQLVFPVGHAIPHLNEWLKWEDDGKRDIDIQKELTYFRHQWEPQYVSRNDKTFPLHDEGFLHRNRDNTAMGHEICRANITFSIMNGLFSVHRGVKRKELARFKKIVADFTRKELPRVVRRFRKRMDMLYDENKGKCPVFAPDIRYDKSKELKEVMEKLETFKDAPVVNLKANYLQQIAFFENYRPQIRELLKFNPNISDAVDKYAHKLFGSSSPHTDIKVCAHMRRNDFITDKNHPLIASQLDFTVPALRLVVGIAKNEANKENVSVVLFSDDMKFVRKVEKEFRSTNKETSIYMPDKLKRLEYMNLASRYCNYYIMTASGSTYGWWTAFLLDDDLQRNVFYNARMFRPHRKDFADQFVESHFFPAKWRRLALDKETKQVHEQDRTKIPLQPQPTSQVKLIRGQREKKTAPLTALKQASMNVEKSAISAQQDRDHTNETLASKDAINQGSGVMLERAARMDDYSGRVPLEANKNAHQATSLSEKDYNEEFNAYAAKGFEGYVYDNPNKPFVEPSNIAMPTEGLCQLRNVIGIEGSVVEMSLDSNMIKVELPGKLSVDWQLLSSGPPMRIEMLGNVHHFMNALYNPLFWKSAHVRSNYVNAPEFVPNQQARVAQNHQQGQQSQYGSQPSLGHQPSQPQQGTGQAHSQQHFGPQGYPRQQHTQQLGQMPQVSVSGYPQHFGHMPQQGGQFQAMHVPYNPMMYRQPGAQPDVPTSMPYQGSQMNGGNYAQHK
ncbi:Cleavage and polyadenylation specificity factor subunit 4 [Aphelenchoides bicaudatus]|nr:Cleavage and polyadenylation specificity factor subunit 4 [Aphelenchoides bicaudatus]